MAKNFFNINKTPKPPEFMPDRNELVWQHNKTFVSAELIDIPARTKINYNEWITDGLNNGYWAPVQNNGKFFKIRNDGTVEGYVGPEFKALNTNDIFIYHDRRSDWVRAIPPAISGNKMYCMPYASNGQMAYINNGVVTAISNSYNNYFNGMITNKNNGYSYSYVANDGTVYIFSNFAINPNEPVLLKFIDNNVESVIPYFNRSGNLCITDKNNNFYNISSTVIDNFKVHVTKITPDHAVIDDIYNYRLKYISYVYDKKLDIYYLFPFEGSDTGFNDFKIATFKNGIFTIIPNTDVYTLFKGPETQMNVLEMINLELFRDINDNLYFPQNYTKSENDTLKRVIKFSNGEVSLVGDIESAQTYFSSKAYVNPTTKAIYYPPAYTAKLSQPQKILKIDYFTGNVSYFNYTPNLNTPNGDNKYLYDKRDYAVDQLGYVWYPRVYTKDYIRMDTGCDLCQFFTVNIDITTSDFVNTRPVSKPIYLDNGDIINVSTKRYVFKMSYGALSFIFNNANMNLNDDIKPYMDKNRNIYYVGNSKILKITQSGVVTAITNNLSWNKDQYQSNTQFMDKKKNFYAIPMAAASKEILKIEYETGNISYITIPGLTAAATHFNNNKPYIDNNGNMYFTPLATGSKILKLNFN